MDAYMPTFQSLNLPQKRAFILRDRLRLLEIPHLDEHIDGIAAEEPPNYKLVNGNVRPAFQEVTVRANAIRFDLGNVHFDTDAGGDGNVQRAYLTVENGRVELRTTHALPEDDQDINSVPIHSFIAKTMLPMFEAKYGAIQTRITNINQIRKVAYDLANQPVQQLEHGKTLARLENKAPPTGDADSPLAKKNQRKSGRSVVKHVSNKRKTVGLNAIPEATKSAIFHDLPARFKVDLFNNVVKTAFPNFDDLMTASWNVVSIYSNVGTDFPELHKAIVELKSVLQAFDENFGRKTSNAATNYRHDLAAPQPSGSGISENVERLVDVSDADEAAAQAHPNAESSGDGNVEHGAKVTDATSTVIEKETALPRLEEPGESSTAPEIADHGELEHDTEEPRRNAHQMALITSPVQQSGRNYSSLQPATPIRRSLFAQEHQQYSRSRSVEPHLAASLPPTPELQRRREEHTPMAIQRAPSWGSPPVKRPLTQEDNEEQSKKLRIKYKDLTEMPLDELREVYRTRRTDLEKKFGQNVNVPKMYRSQQAEIYTEIKKREARLIMDSEVPAPLESIQSRMQKDPESSGTAKDTSHGGEQGQKEKGLGLGSSILGSKKGTANPGDGMAKAPIAKMFHDKE